MRVSVSGMITTDLILVQPLGIDRSAFGYHTRRVLHLDLHIEQSLSVDLIAQRALHVMGEPFLHTEP